ncbi:MAG TPA: DUF3489 domain-containing protein, partial [Bryobacteraceae bacterium]|nr:DUF3489 domain-containing protein [Bryobacteraceae bacterium]
VKPEATAVVPSDVVPAPAPAKRQATRAGKLPKTESVTNGPREGSKTTTILGLLKQPGGTTLKAIMDATSWQAHSVRGFISGTLNKRWA